MSRSYGLSFKKFDLHIHTPASHCYKEKDSTTPDDIVKRALAAGMSAIAITDHNTGEWIDKVKEAAKDTNLTVFPGIEISASGGEAGIHVIGILDVDKGSDDITALLGKIDIDSTKFGSKDASSTMSVYDVINVITSPPRNGIAILAHCTSSKGVLNEIKGEHRKKIFSHPFLFAVETSEHDFTDADKKEKRTRAIDLLNGKEENYCFKKLGVYSASDSHTKDEIGSKFSYFKVDDDISLESLRQCFIDRDVRIRQSFDYKENLYPYIKSIKVTGGFFDGEEAEFHPGLNCILGAKGSGKSLLVEFLRFGLNQPSINNEIRADYTSKLDSKLESYGVVGVNCVDETGSKFTVKRTLDYGNNHPYIEGDGESLPSTFPVLFLSQSEIIKIAEDEDEQMSFIDKFFDFRHYKSRISAIEFELRELDRKFADSLRSFHEKNELQKHLTTYQKESELLSKKLSDAIYDKYKKIERKDSALKLQTQSLEELKGIVNQFIEEAQYWAPAQVEDEIKDDPAIKRVNDILVGAGGSVDAKLKEALQFIDKAAYNLSAEIERWKPIFKKEKEEYENHVRKSGGDKADLELKRKKLLALIEETNKRLATINEKVSKLKHLKELRDKKIDELSSIYSEYTLARKVKCRKFEEESAGRLNIKLHELSNRDEFKKNLLGLKKGTYLREPDIESIVQNTSPNEFILDVLRYDTFRNPDKFIDIAKKTGVEIDKLTTLADFLLNEYEYERLLELQYVAYPQDRPEIRYRVEGGDYEPLNSLSVGQKCTAMLIMSLSEGRFPVVVDQPEDSLDVRSIWDDMCEKLRRGKEMRQFIFTTHNSSIAVASDTDKFSILESDAHRGRVVFSGALENQDVHDEVIRYLEGGKPTYFKKYDKYNFGKEKYKSEES